MVDFEYYFRDISGDLFNGCGVSIYPILQLLQVLAHGEQSMTLGEVAICSYGMSAVQD